VVAVWSAVAKEEDVRGSSSAIVVVALGERTLVTARLDVW